MTLTNLALSLVDVVPDPFIAPVPAARETVVWTIQDGVTYQFPLRDVDPGWWEVTPSSASEAKTTRRAQPAQYLSYLDELPRMYAICLYRLERDTWLCTPYNLSDATQRGWPNGEPRVLHLVRHAVLPFEVVDARLMGDVLLFHQVASRLSVQDDVRACQGALTGDNIPLVAPSFVHAWYIAHQRVLAERQRLEEEQRRLATLQAEEMRREQMATTEGQLRWYLEFMGADLQGWTESGEMFEVTWTYDGHTHSARVSRDLRLDSAGICLGHRGQEQRQNLSSVVAVIQEARRSHRFDMPHNSWL